MLTIHETAEAIRARQLTPVDLLNQCLARIDQLESKVRAWVFVARDEAREQAEALTKELEQGQYRGPLHGIPVGVKDIFDVFDWPTAAGSKLWANSIARRDCTVVERLRQAGAVFLGKTVTTAYASFDPPPTRNPWKLECTPGGSSSGSAAAVACGMCLGALASQTGGSITRPASFCGVCGIKPTYGRISLDGIVPLAPSMDHPGVIAGCIRDLAILFSVIADPTPSFSAKTASTEPEHPPSLGKLGGLFSGRADPVMRNAMVVALNKLHAAGASIVDVDPPAPFAEVLNMHRIIMAVESAEFHETRIKRHPEDYPPRISSLIHEGFRTSATDYVRSLHHKDVLTDAMSEQLQLGVAPAYVVPATLGPAPSADTTGDPAFNSPWSYTGLPVISFPIGWSPDGLPLCVQIIGDRSCEEELFRWALWCEQNVGFERRGVKA
jgi:Asp-tRNA(Asn)/Glu-tRNA(Gln) amidotransferase A subunit family amidase